MKISISWMTVPKISLKKSPKNHVTMWKNEQHHVIGTNILIFVIKKNKGFWNEMGWMARTAFGCRFRHLTIHDFNTREIT